MKDDEFILTQGLGQQLEFAFRRGGWSASEVHAICKGDILGRMREHMLKPKSTLPASLKGELEENHLFEPWKTITIGTHSPDELIKALLEEGYVIAEKAKAVLQSSRFATKPTQVNLAFLTLEDLGLEESYHYLVMCRRIRHMGFELCTPEMAGELRLLNFDDQEDEVSYMAMTPVDGLVLDPYFNETDGLLEIDATEFSEISNSKHVAYICVIP